MGACALRSPGGPRKGGDLLTVAGPILRPFGLRGAVQLRTPPNLPETTTRASASRADDCEWLPQVRPRTLGE